MKKHLNFILPYWKKGLVPVILLLLSTVLTLIYPQLFRIAIDKAIPLKNLSLLIKLASIFIAVIVLEHIFLYFNEMLFFKFQSETLLHIQYRMIKSLFSFPMDFFEQKHSGYLIGRIRTDVLGLNYVFSEAIVENIMAFTKLIIIFIILISINIKLALISFCFLPLLIINILISKPGIRNVNEKTLEASANVQKVLSDTFQGIEVFKSFSNEKEGIEIAYNGLRNHQIVEITRNKILSRFKKLYSLLIHLGEGIFFFFGIREVIVGRLSIGSYIAFNSYLVYLYDPLKNLGGFFYSMDFCRRSLARIEELLNIFPEHFGETKINSIKSIKVNNLKFGFVKDNRILSSMNFEIQKGDRVLIRGESGVGKSTLVKLLLGLYRPDEGSILYNNIDISKLDIKSLRKQIGYISQNVFLFNNTIRENIIFKNKNISDETIIKILIKCGLFEKINKLQKGIHETISEKGFNLSGGERQKLAMARALIKDPEVIIIDEGTSNIDLNTEAEILNLLEKDFKDRILIWITHRDVNPDGWKQIQIK